MDSKSPAVLKQNCANYKNEPPSNDALFMISFLDNKMKTGKTNHSADLSRLSLARSWAGVASSQPFSFDIFGLRLQRSGGSSSFPAFPVPDQHLALQQLSQSQFKTWQVFENASWLIWRPGGTAELSANVLYIDIKLLVELGN